MSKYTRRPRMEEEVCVHLVSRVVQRRRLVDERGMEEMRRMLETQAEFAGLQVITFCFLANHFHVLVRLDPETARLKVSDEELLRRFRALYGSKRSPTLGLDAEALEVALKQDGARAAEVRTQMLARMGDVSVFMREFKTRFTKWYNEEYQSVGTFWAERFRSMLVEPGSLALRAVAAYIDLNPVRAGLVEEPGSYRFCGLGEAAEGRAKARAAYRWLAPSGAARASRETVYAAYVAHVERQCQQIAEQTSALAKSSAARKQAKQVRESLFSNGGALGSRSWVERLCRKGGVFGFLRDRQPKPLVSDEGTDLHAVRQWVR